MPAAAQALQRPPLALRASEAPRPRADVALVDLNDFHRVVALAFEGHAELPGFRFDGPRSQAWEAWSRRLGVDIEAFTARLAQVYGVAAAGPLTPAAPEALALVPAHLCQAHGLLPLRVEQGSLVIATSDPADHNLRERVRFLVGRPLRWVLAPPQAIEDAAALAMALEAQRQSGPDSSQGTLDDNAVVRLTRTLLDQAIDSDASDLHIQPFLGAFAVRMRVDGQLRRLTMLPDAAATSVIRHCMARSGMDPTNHQVPQDGRMNLVHGDREFDLRVSSLPAQRGLRLVLRFLDQSRVHSLSGARFSLAALQALRRSIRRPAGMVVMTGPTGCGKTSTLYGMLAELNRSTVNIITVENPVEYRIAGVSQVEVNEKAGRSFASCLRSILRQDPDIVLIGEIRDAETAEIAAQAALTGHLVLSTLHTNDAVTAIPRLLNLGVSPTILADSLATVVAQRLCRVLCVHCRAPVTGTLTPLEQAFVDVTRNRPAYRAVGCAQCSMTGYRGRLPIVEVVEMNRRLRDAVAAGESRLEVLDGLRDGGLKSLAASGSLRIISGDTTVAEVLEAVGPGFWRELAQHHGRDGLALETPEPEGIDLAGQAVLYLGDDAGLAAQLAQVLEPEGLRLTRAATAEQAHEALAADEDICFIVGDVPEGRSLAHAQQQLAHNRLHISWARLPAAVLLPPELMGHQAALKDSGVMGGFLPKPLAPADLVAFVRRARAR